jgi:hypothetical protein
MIGWKWLAGFTDGDGCICVHRTFDQHPSQVSIHWVQAEEQIELLWAVKDFLDDRGIRNSWSENRTKRATSHVWSLNVYGLPCKPILKGILPYLISEKKIGRANRVLEAWKTRAPRTNVKIHP